MTTMERSTVQMWEARVSGYSFLNISDLQHQHDECEGQSITERDIFKLMLNIITHPFGNKYSLKIIPNSQNSKFTKILSRAQ